MGDTDYAALIEPVARKLWGEPSTATKTQIRWGSQGSKSVDLSGGRWFDHEAGEGGGVIDLVIYATGADKAGAVEWLEENGFLQPRNDNAGSRERSTEAKASATHQTAPDEQNATEAEPRGKPERVAEYDYHDADGELLYRVVRGQWRFPDGSWKRAKDGQIAKTFRQCRPDGRGGWIWNLDGIGHTIYRHNKVEEANAAGRTILLVEGEKDAETAIILGFDASTNSGGAKNWTEQLALYFKGADVVILVDNDETGIAAGEARAKTLRGTATRIRVLNFADHVPNFPHKHDLTNWVEAGGTAEELQRIIDGLPDWTPAPPRSRFNAVSLGQAGLLAKQHRWLVRDMIELMGTCAFAGFSQSGKSFLMIELALCVAMGKPFFGRDVTQGAVLYQVGEGATGFMKRLEGYVLDRGIAKPDELPIRALARKINLFVDDEDTKGLIEEAKEWAVWFEQPIAMLVIDTYNKATRGANEISGQDIGKINERVERIASELNCTVVVIDHLSAQGRMRGHGSKTDDFTNTIRVEVTDKADDNGRKIRRMKLDKNKDGENGGTIPFVLRQVVIGYDEIGKPVSTCVVDTPDGNDEEIEKTGRLSLNQSLVLRTLRDVISSEGEEPPAVLRQHVASRKVVPYKTFMTELRRKWQYSAPENEPEKRAAEVSRVVADAGKKLQLYGFIDRDNDKGLIWWTGKEDRTFVHPAKPAEPLPADVQNEFAGAVDKLPF